MTTKLSPTEIFKDRRIFLIGSTGFLGKVTLSMLLHRFPNVGRVYVTVRARSQEESETRFWNNVITAPPFDPLRERYGSAMDGFIRDKVVVVGGDIAETNLGFSDEEAQRIADDLDIIINSAGNVTFNPTLESGLRTNVVGTQNVIAFTRRMKRPCLVHISTCFVAGNRSGAIWENDEVIGYFPRRGELKGVEFSVEQEIKDCAKMSERAREEAKDAMRVAQFRELARKRLNEEMRDGDDPDALGLAVARERKVWIRNRLTELGVERAKFWGWPNIYTYTKSLGEQLVAAETEIVRSIVRPSIVESAKSYPFPGWNEGFTTTAPIIFMTLKGQRQIPANPKLIIRLEGLKDTHKSWWECKTGIAFLVSGVPSWRVRRMTEVYDLSDPAKPVKIREFGLPGQEPGSAGRVPTELHGMISTGPEGNISTKFSWSGKSREHTPHWSASPLCCTTAPSSGHDKCRATSSQSTRIKYRASRAYSLAIFLARYFII